MLLSFPLHNSSFCTNVLHNRSFFKTTSFCAHEAVWDKGAEELLAPSQGVSLLGRDRVRQCATEPKHFNVQCATEPGRVRHGCAKVGWRAGPMSASPLSCHCAPSFALCCALCCSPCCPPRQSASSTLGEPHPGLCLPLAPTTTTNCTLTLSH